MSRVRALGDACRFILPVTSSAPTSPRFRQFLISARLLNDLLDPWLEAAGSDGLRPRHSEPGGAPFFEAALRRVVGLGVRGPGIAPGRAVKCVGDRQHPPRRPIVRLPGSSHPQFIRCHIVPPLTLLSRRSLSPHNPWRGNHRLHQEGIIIPDQRFRVPK